MDLTDNIKFCLKELWALGDIILYQSTTKNVKRNLSKKIHQLHDKFIEAIQEVD